MKARHDQVPERTVLVTDYTWPSVEPEAAILARVGARLITASSGTEEELLALVPKADAVLTCFAHVSGSVLRAGARLQVVSRYGIGVDNIAVADATKLGIIVTNVPAYCLDEVAEHAMALVFACARRLVVYDRGVRDGDWRLQRGGKIYRIAGRTLGIVGLGRIGRTVARKAQGMSMTVIGYDPTVPARVFGGSGVESVSLDDLAARSDFITLHAPLTDASRGMIDETFLRQMKPSAYLINTARGALIDLSALVIALRQDWIAGAGLDVFDPERLPADHPLLAMPNAAVLTPHVAFYSEESVRELEIQAAENVAAILSGKRPESVVNAEVLRLPRWKHLT